MLFDSGGVVCLQARGPVCVVCHGLLQRSEPVPVHGMSACRTGFVLDDRSLAIIAALKYRRQRRLARWLARSLIDLVPHSADAITWVPATPERRRSRGFDQAEEFARSLARLSGVPAVRLLSRGQDDRRQTGLTREQRLRGPTLTACRRTSGFVVVVDDVITTGSSLLVATAALRDGGAERVVGVVAAATPDATTTVSLGLTIAATIRKWT